MGESGRVIALIEGEYDIDALRTYRCPSTNPRTGHPCNTVLLEAWAPAGALVRRRCKQCGSWALIIVAPSADPGSEERPVLLD